jgi:hypothetical protein
VAHTVGGALSQEGWQPLEREFVEELRWWTLVELELTDAQVYPEGLAELLPDVLAGRYAAEPLLIRTLDGPVRPVPRPARAAEKARIVSGLEAFVAASGLYARQQALLSSGPGRADEEE